MSDYTEHLISMAGGDGEPDLDATERVTEWARQWRMNPNIDKSGTIYNVWFDPEASAVELNLNDIEALLALVRDQAAKLGRVEDLCNSWGRMATTDNTQDTTLRATTYAIRAAITATEASK